VVVFGDGFSRLSVSHLYALTSVNGASRSDVPKVAKCGGGFHFDFDFYCCVDKSRVLIVRSRNQHPLLGLGLL